MDTQVQILNNPSVGTSFTSKTHTFLAFWLQFSFQESGHGKVERCITRVTSQPLSCPTSALPGVLFLHPLLFPPKPNQPSQTFKIGIDELWTLPKRHGIFESQSWHCQIFSNLLHPIKMYGWFSPKNSQIANKKSCKPHGIMASTWIKKSFIWECENPSPKLFQIEKTLRSFF